MSKQYSRIVGPFIGASVAFAALQWLQWAVTGGPSRRGIPTPVWWCVGLSANIVLTLASHRCKRFVFRLFQKYLLNPPIRLLLHLGLMPLGFALLETRGRKTGQPRRNPVGNGLVGDTFWIIAEHGERAGYVRNIRHDPRVRVKLRRGLRFVWVDGTAEVRPDDDAWARQRRICRWHPLRILNAVNVQVAGTKLLTVRVDLSPAAGRRIGSRSAAGTPPESSPIAAGTPS